MIGQDIIRGSEKVSNIRFGVERLTLAPRPFRFIAILEVVAMIGVFLLIGISLFGCATTARPKLAPALEKSHVVVFAHVRISQMGADCTGSASFMEATVRGLLLSQGIPSPDKLELRLRSGSSLCGYAQGVANEVVMPELGARDTAEAEMTLHWSAISSSELRRVWTVLNWMAPAAPPQTASLK